MKKNKKTYININNLKLHKYKNITFDYSKMKNIKLYDNEDTKITKTIHIKNLKQLLIILVKNVKKLNLNIDIKQYLQKQYNEMKNFSIEELNNVYKNLHK